MMLKRGGRLITLGGLVFLGALASSQCSQPGPAPQTQAPASAVPHVAAPLLAEMKPVVSVKELMQYMIDPIADNIFDAVWWDVTSKGTVAHEPKTDEDWEKVKVGAVTMIEGIYLLNVPRPFAPAGDVNNSIGANAPELSPTQIQAKLDKDPVLWIAKVEALRNVGLETLEAVKKKDVKALFQASGDLDIACEECHLEYWYPGDKQTVLTERKARGTPGRPATARPLKGRATNVVTSMAISLAG
jgi:hypothetical protein